LSSDNKLQAGLQTRKPGSLDRYWLPDLCRTEALVWVTLLAVIFAIILELLLRGANFSVTSLGQGALLILWMVLIGCFISCLIRRISIAWPLWAIVVSVMLGIQLAGLFGAWGQMLVTGSGFLDRLIPSQLLSALIGAVALRFFYIRDQERQRADRLQQAELELLQARIQPHFLFNTLNSIASLIVSSPDKAEGAVLDLADLMRSSLNAGQQRVTLAEELELCEKYLQIESLRMGERLRWNFVASPEAAAAYIPSLSLQPLIENSLLHGVARIPEGGTIELDARTSGDELCLDIRNPISEEPASSAGN
jgi:two-component system sensor histidine kinase AlgZ